MIIIIIKIIIIFENNTKTSKIPNIDNSEILNFLLYLILINTVIHNNKLHNICKYNYDLQKFHD